MFVVNFFIFNHTLFLDKLILITYIQIGFRVYWTT